MYYNIDERRSEAELGITIGERDYWGRGFGRDAVATFVRFIFETTRLRRVYLNTLAWNERARRAFEAAGFQACGRRRRDGNVFITMEVVREEEPRRSAFFPA
jgi:RimJ/RimL family protein N-acetyltransferase